MHCVSKAQVPEALQSMKDKCLQTSTDEPLLKRNGYLCWNDWTADFTHFYFKGLNKNISLSVYFILTQISFQNIILNKSIVFDIWIYPLPKVHNRWTSLELKLKVSTSVTSTEATQQNVSLSNNLPINCSIYLLWNSVTPRPRCFTKTQMLDNRRSYQGFPSPNSLLIWWNPWEEFIQARGLKMVENVAKMTV